MNAVLVLSLVVLALVAALGASLWALMRAQSELAVYAVILKGTAVVGAGRAVIASLAPGASHSMTDFHDNKD